MCLSTASQTATGSILDWYRRLIALRHAEPALADPRLDQLQASGSDRTLHVTRGPFHIAANFSDRDAKIPLSPPGPLDVIASWVPCEPPGDCGDLHLPAHSVAVLRER